MKLRKKSSKKPHDHTKGRHYKRLIATKKECAVMVSKMDPCPFCGSSPEVYGIHLDAKGKFNHVDKANRFWLACCIVYIPHNTKNGVMRKWQKRSF